MRIAVIGPLGLPFTAGGITRHCAEVYPRLAARGHDVTLYGRSRHSGPAGRYDGVRLVRVPVLPGVLETPGYAAVASVLASATRFDVVHVHGTVAAGFSWLPRALGRRLAFTVHSVDHEHAKWGRAARGFLRFSERTSVHAASVVIAVSAALADGLRSRYPGVDVRVITNGVTPPVDGGADVVRALGLEPGRYLLFVGRLVPEKGLRVLLDAHRGLDVPLVVVGDTRRGDVPVAGEGVVALGRRTGAELGALYHHAAAFVAPSTDEGFNLTALEALASGRCVIASDLPVHREVLADDAVYVPTGDRAALAAAMAGVLGDPARASAIGARGRERVLGDRRYSWDRVADEVEAALD